MAVLRVSGYPGSGKTTLCKRLAAELGYEYHYAGGIFRKMAQELGLSIEQFYEQISEDPSIETTVDDRQAAIMMQSDNLIMEGRIAPFKPSPFRPCNILLTVAPREGARRQLLRSENAQHSLEKMAAHTESRTETERAHYRSLYGINDHFGKQHFDIVIDTTELTRDEVFEQVMRELRDFLGISAAASRG